VKGELPAGYASIFRYSLLDPAADVAAEAAAFRAEFSHLALLAQVPGVDLRARVEAEKGGPLTDRERAILDERAGAARAWLEAYAPERVRMTVRDTLPPEAAALEADQRDYLRALAVAGEAARPAAGDAWQALIFSTAVERGLPNGRAFAALYLAFLGRPNGPRAGWLLASLDPVRVVARLREAADADAAVTKEVPR
jgi:lysyl-tRNA synthetase class I